MKLFLFLLFLTSCSTHKMIVVNTSYIEGCEAGVYTMAASLSMQLNPIKVSTICQAMYLETLKIKNPQYEEIKVEDQGLLQI